MLNEITFANFEKEVISSKKPVLIDFWAKWCNDSKKIQPIIDEIAVENPQIKIARVDVDREIDLRDRFKIVNIPAFLLFENGELKDSIFGNQTKETIKMMLENEKNRN